MLHGVFWQCGSCGWHRSAQRLTSPTMTTSQPEPDVRTSATKRLPTGSASHSAAARGTLSGRNATRVDRTRRGEASWTDGHRHPSASTDADDPMLRLAVAAHLARYQGVSRAHTASDHQRLSALVPGTRRDAATSAACTCRGLPALGPGSPPPSALDGVTPPVRARHLLPHLCHRPDPRPLSRRVRATSPFPLESPTLGLSHLQLEAILTAGRDSTSANDFALVAMLEAACRAVEVHSSAADGARKCRNPRARADEGTVTTRLTELRDDRLWSPAISGITMETGEARDRPRITAGSPG